MESLRITTDPAEIDVAHSLCFGGCVAREQVAFARVITDRATLATANAHGLHAEFGFAAPRHLQSLMSRCSAPNLSPAASTTCRR